jgi:hypothetical protein
MARAGKQPIIEAAGGADATALSFSGFTRAEKKIIRDYALARERRKFPDFVFLKVHVQQSGDVKVYLDDGDAYFVDPAGFYCSTR